MTKYDMEKLGMIYEGHFYHDMDYDMKNQYYDNIMQVVKPFADRCHEVAIAIENVQRDVENVLYSDEWKNVEQMLEAYTEDPRLEKREFQTHILNVVTKLRHACSDMENDEIRSQLTDVFLGQKIQ